MTPARCGDMIRRRWILSLLRIKSMMMTVLFQKEKMGRTERKILQLDRFSLLVVPVFYLLTAGIFIALHRT